MIIKTPQPPYYAVIFTSKRTEGDNGYNAMSSEIDSIAESFPGYYGMESGIDADGYRISISYWDSLESVKNWKNNLRHQEAMRLGREVWYEHHKTRVCKVERDSEFGM